VFGSAARDDFDEQSSDIDLLFDFEELPFPDRADAYVGLLIEAEALLGRHVDLVEVGAVRNPDPVKASRHPGNCCMPRDAARFSLPFWYER
jgi:predicted nucleotidyltransferase